MTTPRSLSPRLNKPSRDKFPDEKVTLSSLPDFIPMVSSRFWLRCPVIPHGPYLIRLFRRNQDIDIKLMVSSGCLGRFPSALEHDLAMLPKSQGMGKIRICRLSTSKESCRNNHLRPFRVCFGSHTLFYWDIGKPTRAPSALLGQMGHGRVPRKGCGSNEPSPRPWPGHLWPFQGVEERRPKPVPWVNPRN